MAKSASRPIRTLSSPCFRDSVATGILLAATAIITAACRQAPELTGHDQVHDPNVTLTGLQDNHVEQMSWADVDQVILNELVPNPETEPGCAVGIVRDGEIIYLQGY